MAEQAIEENQLSATLGPLIHNPQVVEELLQQGVRVVEQVADMQPGETLMIRTHGCSPDVEQEAQERGVVILDATCPFVKKAQAISKLLNDRGYAIIIVGDKDHPEVKSLSGFARDSAYVVGSPSDLKNLNLDGAKKIGLLAQTTKSKEDFQAITRKLIKDGVVELRVFNTICEAVALRQDEARSLARECDLMLVVGGKQSANTRTLAKLCRMEGTRAYHIEGFDGLDLGWLRRKRSVGIVSGTSTPKWVIEGVVKKLMERR